MILEKHLTSCFFVVCLPALSFGIGWLFWLAFPEVPFWVETISPLAAYGLLYGFFDAHAWHWPIFRWCGIVTAPDVRGRWLGEQTSSFKDGNGKPRKSRVIMEIEQRFTSVVVRTYYKNWQTTHSLASFMLVENSCMLFILFESEPRVTLEAETSAHKGVVRLSQRPDKTLVGSYFNANGHSGELSFRRTRYTLHHTFESVGGK